jgi:hypothetical protein
MSIFLKLFRKIFRRKMSKDERRELIKKLKKIKIKDKIELDGI